MSVMIIHQLYKPSLIHFIVLGTVLAISLLKIYHYRKVFRGHTERYTEVVTLMKQHNIQIALLSRQAYRSKELEDIWASPYETMLMNSIVFNGDGTRSCYITYCMTCCEEQNQNFDGIRMDNTDSLNSFYFRLPKGKYVKIDSLYNEVKPGI